MIQLKEALIGRHNIDSVGLYSTNINKKEFSTGDVVLMRNGNIGVIVFIKDIKNENLYYGIHVSEYGSMIEPELEKTNAFTGLDLNSYRDDGTSMWVVDFDIIKIIKKDIPVNICKNPSRLYRELTSSKFDILKESISEALIGRHNIKNASSYPIITRKSDLRIGDLCMQRDGQIGVYVEDIDLSKFNIHSKDYATILFLNKEQGVTWEHYPVKYLNDSLKDIDGESESDMIKVVRAHIKPQVCKDPNLLYKYLSDKRNYTKYFE